MNHKGSRPATRLELRELSSVAELRPLEALQRTVWGVDDLEIVPATAMSAATHAGGLVVGAFVGSRLVGFAYGFVATPHGRGMVGTGLHSHMAAVLPGQRSGGVGRALKRYQAEWCRRNGLGWISWTFDPLLAKNARFNISILGARAFDYLVDVYGPMPGALGGGIASDRLLALWSLDDEKTPDAQMLGAATADREGWLLGRGAANEPLDGHDAVAGSSFQLRVAAPAEDLDVFDDADNAMAWRAAHRRTLGTRLAAGYVVTGFEGGAYVLSPPMARTNLLEQLDPQHL